MKYVITGGACVGKTTMINELKRRGYQVVGESARIIIDSEQVHEKMNPTYKGVFPWVDNHRFQEMVIKLQISLEAKLADENEVFLDRSLVDGLAYSKVWDTPEIDGLRDLIKNSNYTKVFFLDRLEFYEQDDQRQESEEMNAKVHEKLFEVYTDLGFDVIRVPALPIDERVQFIIDVVDKQEESHEVKLLDWEDENISGIDIELDGKTISSVFNTAHGMVHGLRTLFMLLGMTNVYISEKQNGKKEETLSKEKKTEES